MLDFSFTILPSYCFAFPVSFLFFCFVFNSNSSRLHWVWKCSKLIRRDCFFGDLPQHEEGNNGLELKNQFRACQNSNFSSSRICLSVSLCVGSPAVWWGWCLSTHRGSAGSTTEAPGTHVVAFLMFRNGAGRERFKTHLWRAVVVS